MARLECFGIGAQPSCSQSKLSCHATHSLLQTNDMPLIIKYSISLVIIYGNGANSATGTRTRVARVRAEYPNQLDYSGHVIPKPDCSYKTTCLAQASAAGGCGQLASEQKIKMLAGRAVRAPVTTTALPSAGSEPRTMLPRTTYDALCCT